jgi:chaperonin GroES
VIQPINAQVMVKRTREGDTRVGMLVIPDTCKEKTYEGRVVAVGPGWKGPKGFHPVEEVKVGDYVVWGRYDGTEEHDGHVFIPEPKIMAVIENV